MEVSDLDDASAVGWSAGVAVSYAAGDDLFGVFETLKELGDVGGGAGVGCGCDAHLGWCSEC